MFVFVIGTIDYITSDAQTNLSYYNRFSEVRGFAHLIDIWVEKDIIISTLLVHLLFLQG